MSRSMRTSSLGALTAALALLLGATVPGPAAATVFEPEQFMLDNGMQVVVVTNRSAPVVTHMVWYRIGAADEAPGESGIAHFLEHLMFRGTDMLDDGEFSRTVARNGGTDNAFTSWDYTAYYQNVAVDRLPVVMEMEANRMTHLILNEDVIATERNVIIEERRQRIDDDPGARLGEQMTAALYQNHPYGVPIIGWEHEMAQLELDETAAFYRMWYSPGNAILVVSGDIDAEELRPLAEQYYGTIPSHPIPARHRPQEPEDAVARRIVLSDPNVQQPSWTRYYLAPSYTTEGDDSTAYALQVADEVLGAGTSSRLYGALVLDQGLAVGAGSWYSPAAIDETTFGLYATPADGVDLDVLEAAMDAEVERLLTDGVTAEEVDAAKERLVLAAIYARDSVSGPANILGRSLASGQTVEDVEAWPDRIAAVTVDDVMAAVRQTLRAGRSVTGLLVPEVGDTASAGELVQ